VNTAPAANRTGATIMIGSATRFSSGRIAGITNAYAWYSSSGSEISSAK
jgi:hypothetical protein